MNFFRQNAKYSLLLARQLTPEHQIQATRRNLCFPSGGHKIRPYAKSMSRLMSICCSAYKNLYRPILPQAFRVTKSLGNHAASVNYKF
jgi:hypothetical protein